MQSLSCNQARALLANRSIQIKNEKFFGFNYLDSRVPTMNGRTLLLALAIPVITAIGSIIHFGSKVNSIEQKGKIFIYSKFDHILINSGIAIIGVFAGIPIMKAFFYIARVVEVAINFFRGLSYRYKASSIPPTDASPIRGPKLQSLLTYSVQNAVKTTLLGKMDVEQLGEARNYLGHKRFALLTKDLKSEALSVWRTIEGIVFQKTAAEINAAVDRLLAPEEKGDPYLVPFLTALENEITLQQPQLLPEIQERLGKRFSFMKKMTIEVENYPSIIIHESAARKIDGSFDGPLFGGASLAGREVPGTVKLTKELITSKAEYESACRIFKLLNGEGYSGELNQWSFDIAFADTRFGKVAVEMLEEKLKHFQIPQNFETYVELCAFYVNTNKPTLPKLLMVKLFELYMEKKDCTPEQDADFDQRYHTYELFRPHMSQKFQKPFLFNTPTYNQLRMFFLATEMDSFVKIFKDASITKDNLKDIYLYFSKAQGAAADTVVKACKKFTQQLPPAERNTIFGYLMTPAALLEK